MSQNPSHRVVVLGAIVCGFILLSLALVYGIWVGHSRMQRRTAHKAARILCPPRRPSTLEPGSLELGRVFMKGDTPGHDSYLLLPHNPASCLPSTPPHAHVPPSSPFAPPGLPQCKNADSLKTPVLVITKTPDHQSVDVLFHHADSTPAEWLSQPQDKPATSNEGFGLREGQEGVKRMTSVGPLPSPDELICDSSTFAGHPDVEGAALSGIATDLCPDSTTRLSENLICTTKMSSEWPSPPVSSSLRALVVNPVSMQHEWPAKGESEKVSSVSTGIPTLISSSPGSSSMRRGLGVSSRDRGHGSGYFWNLNGSSEQNDLVNERKAPLRHEELHTPRSPQPLKFLEKRPIRSHIHSMCASIVDHHSLVLQPYHNSLKHPRPGTDDYHNPNDHSTVYTRPAAAFNVTNECLKRDASAAASFSFPGASVFDHAKLRTRGIVPTVVVELARLTSPLPRPARCITRPRAPGPRPGYI